MEVLPSRLVLLSIPRMVSMCSLPGDSADGKAGETHGSVGSWVSDAGDFASFALVLSERGLVGVESGLSFEFILALFLLRLRLDELVFEFTCGLKLSKLLSCRLCSLFDIIAVMETVFATRDSSNELGIEII